MYRPKNKFKNISNTIKSATLNDFSRGLIPEEFQLSDVCHYGIAGRVLSMAFDPVQSLLALANDRGEIHVMGQKHVEIVLKANAPEPILYLKFVKNVFLVAVSASSTLSVFSLESKRLLTDYPIPGKITCIEADASLDWMFIGLDNGSIMIYDVVTGHISRHKIPSLQKSQVIRKSWQASKYQSPGMVPQRVDNSVKSLQIHPRDIGTILVAYAKVAVLYSLAEGKIKREFIYEVPPGAPGGDLTNVETARKPDILKAVFHPNGLNILTCHDDGSLVFWDTNNGTLIQARTIFDTDVDRPQSQLFHNPRSVRPLRYNRITQIEWICESNPENTSLLIAGGDSIKDNDSQLEQSLNLTKIEFETTPKYSITSYEKMSQFYSIPKNLKVFPITLSSSIRRFLPLPVASPFFAGNHDPNVVLVLLQNGVIEVLRYPIGKLVYNASILPPSLSWVHPKLTCLAASTAPRTQWIGILDAVSSARKRKLKNAVKPSFYDETILKGGAAAPAPVRVFSEGRSLFITGHSDGSVKLWDASHSELDETTVMEIDTSFGLNSSSPSPISKVSFSGHTTDLIIGNYDGQAIIYKFGSNPSYNPNISQEDYDQDFSLTAKMNSLSMKNGGGLVVNVEKNIPAYVQKGFLPVIAIRSPVRDNATRLQITALKNSHIEFAAIAYNDGQFVVIDERVSDIIFLDNVNKYTSKRKSTGSLSYVTSIEFGIMKGSDDAKYSSILLFLGTSVGSLITFQIFPGASPNSRSRFQINFLGSEDADNSKIRNIIPLNAETGEPAVAKTKELTQLGSGVLIKGLILTVSSNGVRLFKSPTHKSGHVNFPDAEIISADVSRVHSVNPDAAMEASVLTVVFANSLVKILALPSLNEISTMRLPYPLNRNIASQSTVLLNGDIVIRKDEHEGVLTHITKFGLKKNQYDNDLLFNLECQIPARPVFNSLQWARGSKITTIKDLELLFHGEKRPKSKYPKESDLASKSQSASVFTYGAANPSADNVPNANDPYGSYGSSSSSTPAPVQRIGTAKPANNGGWGFNVGNIQKSFNNTFADLETKFNDAGGAMSESMNESVEGTKNSIMKSFVKSKFSF